MIEKLFSKVVSKLVITAVRNICEPVSLECDEKAKKLLVKRLQKYKDAGLYNIKAPINFTKFIGGDSGDKKKMELIKLFLVDALNGCLETAYVRNSNSRTNMCSTKSKCNKK
ncbi:MAG: hypothetical protein LBS47_01825 [Endomicrobium sp.]|nr:hypothetical protein [Endomicrobium sp.]